MTITVKCEKCGKLLTAGDLYNDVGRESLCRPYSHKEKVGVLKLCSTCRTGK